MRAVPAKLLSHWAELSTAACQRPVPACRLGFSGNLCPPPWRVAVAGMSDLVGRKFVEMNDSMLKLAKKGDLEAFQVAGFPAEEMGKAIDELRTWCN